MNVYQCASVSIYACGLRCPPIRFRINKQYLPFCEQNEWKKKKSAANDVFTRIETQVSCLHNTRTIIKYNKQNIYVYL